MLTVAFIAATALVTSTPVVAQHVLVLHTFTGSNNDGAEPIAGLILDSSGNLYGTTLSGGAYGYGAVFELSRNSGGAWIEKTLHSFVNANGIDGFGPYGGLVFDASGNLYGTTFNGGTFGYGTVFKLARRAGGAWQERILHNFNDSSSDGGGPTGNLILDTAGNLYGTTTAGGAYGFGTAFKMARTTGGAWEERILHSFSENGTDGGLPYAGLSSDALGNLYGVTFQGGAFNYGIAFKLAPSPAGWTETILHNFNLDGSDGINPYGNLVLDATGNLYGTTQFGGVYGIGTAFELTPQAVGGWNETILHNFGGSGTDGYGPQAGLALDALGNLYGTTYTGFIYVGGTVFELSPGSGGEWVERVLYGFNERSGTPWALRAPVAVGASGEVYGTAFLGGAYKFGAVYEIAP